MDVKKIMMPDGKLRTFFCGDDQTWSEVIKNVVLPMWQGYCNDHWIDHTNHESMWSFEKRTKAFLDRIAWLMLKDGSGGEVESAYKAMSHKVRELPASECPPEVNDYFYSQRVSPVEDIEEDTRFDLLIEKLEEEDKRPKRAAKKIKKETRFDRIARIHKQYPGARKVWCMVDADNCFSYMGADRRISDDAAGYKASENHESMDRVLVVDDGIHILYYDQNAFPLDKEALVV